MAIITPAASATNYTWSGEGLYTAPFWSNAANWSGGVAPASSSSVGALTFPILPSADCPNTVTDACYGADNDLTDLDVDELQIEDTHGYALSGNAFTLGAGGLNLSNQKSANEQPTTHVSLPLTLGASQTWSITSAANTFQDLEVTGELSGSSAALGVNLDDAALTLGTLGPRSPAPPVPDDEVGNVTVTGPATGNVTFKGPEAVPVEGTLELNADLDATDGHTLTVHNLNLETDKETGPINAIDSRLALGGTGIGALSMTGSLLELSGPLQVPSAALDAGSLIEFPLDNRGTVSGTDYDPLTATGPVDLGGATLDIPASIQPTLQTGECPPPPVGATYTLMSTTGSLTGTFGNAPDGGTVTETECLTIGPHGEVTVDESYPFRIEYNTTSSPETVTVTALGSVPVNTIPPGISGITTEGQALTDVPGTWEGSPTSFSYQWERCNTLGAECSAISGATGQSYTITADDVGSEIRVEETGINGEGAGSPAVSDPTRVVQAAAGGGGAPPGGGGSTGGGSTSTSSGSTATGSTASSTTTGNTPVQQPPAKAKPLLRHRSSPRHSRLARRRGQRASARRAKRRRRRGTSLSPRRRPNTARRANRCKTFSLVSK